MDDDSKFWVSIMVIICGGIIALSLTIMTYWINHNGKVVALIENGVSPVEAMCAMQNRSGNNRTCLILAAKR